MSQIQSRDMHHDAGPSTSPPINTIESITSIANMTAIHQSQLGLALGTPFPVSPNSEPQPNVPIPIQLPVSRPPLSHQLSNRTTSSADSAQSTEKASGFTRLRRGSSIRLQPVSTSLEMTLRSSVSIGGESYQSHGAGRTGGVNARQKWGVGEDGDALNRRVRLDRTKEELAMSKWRKWIVEQPIQTIPIDGTLKSQQKHSAAIFIPMVPINTSSLTATSVNSQPPLPPAAGTELSPSGSGAAPPSSRASTSKLQDGDSLVYNTDSIRSLENVELAVDETLLSSAAAKAASRPRRMSSNPRVSETENPFVEIAPRLASRRVRPLVIELIQALGHYIDAVWSVTHPDRRCPWVAEHERNEGSPLPHHASADEWDRWTSPMVTAVQEGKASGHVTAPPTHRDVAFWGEEVRFAMRDVDEVVGIYKGIFWAFSAAVKHGGYGEILPENVFGENSRGGNMARLLNDLEEAVWGDAVPRPLDLAYDLPLDFDPYARPDPDDPAMSTGPGGGSLPLTEFLSASLMTYMGPMPVPDDIYNMPDLIEAGMGSESGHTDLLRSPYQAVGSEIGLNVPDEAPRSMTLEEIGKKRHEEWLRSRGSSTDW